LARHVRDKDWFPYGHPLKRGRTYLTDAVFLTQGVPAPTVALVLSQRHLFEIAVTYDKSGYAARIFGVAAPSLDDPKVELQWWATSEKSLAEQDESCHEVLSPTAPKVGIAIGDARGHRFALYDDSDVHDMAVEQH
jgi:hypothetical protein